MRQLRKDMSEGTRNLLVMYAMKEKIEEISPRNDFNKNTQVTPEVGEVILFQQSSLQHIDIRFSNLCNFKCRM